MAMKRLKMDAELLLVVFGRDGIYMAGMARSCGMLAVINGDTLRLVLLIAWLAAGIWARGPCRAADDSGLALPLITPNPEDAEAWKKYVEEGWDSPFGLDYVFVLDREFRKPDLARQFGGFMGVRWANFARINWGEIEPRAPAGGKHTYHWEALDEGVRQWQRYGVHILMSLRFVSPWANAQPTLKPLYLDGLLSWIPKTMADYVPKPEHRQDLRDFVRALVERYDGDGVDDMPGLLFPILHYQVCNEAYNELFWGGTVEEYGAQLKEAAQAARDACPKAKVVLSGVCFRPMDGFYDREMEPRTKTYVESLLPKTASKMLPFLKRMDEFSRQSLRFPEYDILDARWSFYGVVEHCREELRQAGRADTEIWSAEMYSAVPLLDALILPMTTLGPYPTPSRSLDYIRITRSPKDKEFEVVNRWYRAKQSAMVVKLCLVGLHAGTKKLMNGWALDSQVPLAPYPLGVGGYKSTTFDKLWPAAYTYKLLIGKLDGITSCRRLPMPEYVYVYECTVRGGRSVLIAFLDDHLARNHDEPGVEMAVTIPLPTGPVRLTRIITDIGATQPKTETLQATSGRLSLSLSEYPVFIEPGANP